MGKRPAYPGLQGKFESFIRENLSPGGRRDSRDLIDVLSTRRAEYHISDDEFEHIAAQRGNYFTRAINAGLILNHGTRQGYSLKVGATPDLPWGHSDDSATRDVENKTASAVGLDQATSERTENRQWESLLHFPLSVSLQLRFDALVVSLPVTERVKWANPDMLMVRATARTRLPFLHADLDPDIFQAVDVSPRLILSSIEAKINVRRNRSLLFQAIAECAANSRWANEAWLIVFETDTSTGAEPFPSDALSLARETGVGLIELTLERDSDGAVEDLALNVHLDAQTRSTLRLSETETSDVLLRAQGLIHEFDSDEESPLQLDDAERLVAVIVRALENLARQKGFVQSGSTFPDLTCWDRWKIGESEKRLPTELLQATILHAAGEALDASKLKATLISGLKNQVMTGVRHEHARRAIEELMRRAELSSVS